MPPRGPCIHTYCILFSALHIKVDEFKHKQRVKANRHVCQWLDRGLTWSKSQRFPKVTFAFIHNDLHRHLCFIFLFNSQLRVAWTSSREDPNWAPGETESGTPLGQSFSTTPTRVWWELRKRSRWWMSTNYKCWDPGLRCSCKDKRNWCHFVAH